MRVLVTGVRAAFARVLLAALCRHPRVEAVTAADRLPGLCEDPKVRTLDLDFRDPAFSTALAGHDALVHLPPFDASAQAPSDASIEEAARAAHRLFHAARAAGVRRLIHMSTAAVYGNAVHAAEHAPFAPLGAFPYAQQQARLEALLAIDLPDCVRLRPHVIAGPHAHPSLKRVLRLPFYPREPRPLPLFQCVHEDDLAAAVLLCLEGDASGPYNLATEDSFSLRDAIRARHLVSFGLSASAAASALRLASRVFRLDLEAAWLERAGSTLLINSRRAVTELGWRRNYTALRALSAC